MDRDDEELFALVLLLLGLGRSAPAGLRGPPGIQGPPGPRSYRSRARGPIWRGEPLYPSPGEDGRVAAMVASEEALAAFAGFAGSDASDGDPVDVYFAGPVPLFAGLSTATSTGPNEYFIDGPGPPKRWADVADRAWARRVGPALNASTLLSLGGELIQKGTMPLKLNANGHLVPDPNAAQTKNFVAGAAIAANTAVYVKQADGKVYPLDGTEAAANAFIGIVIAAVTLGGTATVYMIGCQITTTGLSLTDGEVYAKEDGSLVAFSAVGSQKFTLVVLEADGANSGTVVKGPVEQTS